MILRKFSFLPILSSLFLFTANCCADSSCLEEYDCGSFELKEDFYAGVLGGFSGGCEINCDVGTNLGYYGGIFGGYQFEAPYRFLTPWRIEGEFSYRTGSLRSLQNMGTIQLEHVRGRMHIWSFLANIIVDINCDFPVRPYIGVGVGYALAHAYWSGVWTETITGTAITIRENVHRKMHKNGMAGQIIGGLRYLVCQCYGIEAGLEYRFFRIGGKICNHNLDLSITKFF